jgi:CMP-2-keto-3-deoxyoctulosonic acid synthetase
MKNNNVVAIIGVKKDSKRLFKKNLRILGKYPLFWQSIKCFTKFLDSQNIYVATNSMYVKKFCNKKKINVIWRGPNKSYHEEQLFDVLKYAYSTLNFKPKYILSVLANSPFHTDKNILDLINLIKTDKYNEVRSFDKNGNETGLFAFKSKVLDTQFQISSHLGMICANAKEIHYLKELDGLKKKLKIT